MRKRFPRALALVVVLLLLGVSGALAGGGTTTASLSGYEVFPGIHLQRDGVRTTYGASFGGWATGQAGWQPFGERNGGYWTASVNYTGDAGIGKLVPITGGTWLLRLPGHGIKAGKILHGTVTWPASMEDSLGCGAGVGVIEATLGKPFGSTAVGALSGCLDDTHLDVAFPPRAWANLTFD